MIIANAGEVNAGDFDPVADLADLAERYGAWLHVDGAFGLFAALSPRTQAPDRGHRAGRLDRRRRPQVAQRAVRERVRADPRAVAAGPRVRHARRAVPARAARTRPAATGCSARSRRAAAGRCRSGRRWPRTAATGYRAMVERHLDLAQRLARLVDEAPDLERLADVPLCIVCFRARPPGVPEEDLDDLNRRLGAALLADGRVFAGTTVYDGRVALRPAIVNWRTTDADVDTFVAVVRSLIPR